MLKSALKGDGVLLNPHCERLTCRPTSPKPYPNSFSASQPLPLYREALCRSSIGRSQQDAKEEKLALLFQQAGYF